MDGLFGLIDFFIESIKRYGLSGVLIIIICCFVFVLLGFIKKRTEEKLASSFWKAIRPVKKTNKELLLEHRIFVKIKYWLNYRLTNVNTDCPLREDIFIDIMSSRLKIIEEEYLKLIESEDYEKLDSIDFGYKVLGTVESTFSLWYEDCNRKGIPEFILKQFENYIYEFVCVIRRVIISLFESEYPGHNNTEKLYNVFDLFASSEEWIFSELERTLDSFNGEFKNLEYKGKKCKKCEICVHEKFFKERTLRNVSSKIKLGKE